MADTTATLDANTPRHTSCTIPVDPDKCTVTVPNGIYSAAIDEDVANLEFSLDGTNWVAPDPVAGRIVWSNHRGNGGTFYLRKSSGSQGAHLVLGRGHL